MRKLPLKSVIFAIFCVLFTGACLEQPDIDKFLNDDEVLDFIERLSEKVGLIDHTGDNLTAASERINGFKADKYYMVDVLNENMESQGIKFVTENGALSSQFNQIRRIKVTTITGLNNNYTYAVYSSAITGNMIYYDMASPPPPTGTPITITANANGIITLPVNNNTYYLELMSNINTTSEILKLSINPMANTPDAHAFITGRIIKLEDKGTITDYIFHDADNTTSPLRFLQVIIKNYGAITIALAPYSIQEIKFLSAEYEISVSQDNDIHKNNGIFEKTINISNYTSFSSTSWKWDFEGANITSKFNPANGKFTINLGDSSIVSGDGKSITQLGKHTISVTAQGGGKNWSAVFVINVTD